MRPVKLFLPIIVTMFFCSCSLGNDHTTDPDYSVLGLTAITINSTAHSVSGDMLIDHDSEITISSVQYNKATKHAVIEYAVIASAKNVIVSAESIFPDVSIVISEGTNLDGRFYKALDATRPNYTERVSYKFYLIDPFK